VPRLHLQVVERFVQRQSQLLLSHSQQRLLLQLEVEPITTAADFPHQHVSAQISTAAQPPVLCSLQFTRTSGERVAVPEVVAPPCVASCEPFSGSFTSCSCHQLSSAVMRQQRSTRTGWCLTHSGP